MPWFACVSDLPGSFRRRTCCVRGSVRFHGVLPVCRGGSMGFPGFLGSLPGFGCSLWQLLGGSWRFPGRSWRCLAVPWRFLGGSSGLLGLHSFMNCNVGLVVFTLFLPCQFAWLYTLAVRWRFPGGSLAVPGGSWRFPGGSWRFLAVPWHLPMVAGFDPKEFHTPNRSQPNDQ